jgi:hypothetical protein
LLLVFFLSISTSAFACRSKKPKIKNMFKISPIIPLESVSHEHVKGKQLERQKSSRDDKLEPKKDGPAICV